MTKHLSPGFLALLVAATAVAAEDWPQARMVAVSGVARCYNYTHSLGLWCTLPRKDRPGRLLVRDGDLLAAMRSEKRDDGEAAPIFVPYRDDDGTTLEFRHEGLALRLGDKTIGLRLSDDSPAWEWVKAVTAEQAAALRCLTFPDKLDAPHLALLKKLATLNPAIGLAVEDKEALTQVLPLFRPRLLVTGGASLNDEQRRLLLSKVELEMLWAAPGEGGDLSFIDHLPRLRRLTLGDWKPKAAALLPWGARRLHELTLSVGAQSDLAAIEHLSEVRALRLIDSNKLSDLSALALFGKLDTLMLSPDNRIEDYSALRRLPGLKRLSISLDTDQEGFEAFVQAVPKVETLELLGCKGVKSLAPLKELRHLKHLVLLGEPPDLSALASMKHLEVLVLSDEVFKKAGEKVAALEKALPDTKVAEGHVCLGSGWILLLVPALAAGWVLGRRRGARAGGADG